MNIPMATFGNQRSSLAQTKQDLTKLSMEELMDIEVAPSQKASNLWWQANWPMVAAGLGVLGVLGYVVFKKK